MPGDDLTRDRLARWLANWILNHIATRTYSDRLNATYAAGMAVWKHPDVADLLVKRMKETP